MPGYELSILKNIGEVVTAAKFNAAGLASLDSILHRLPHVMRTQLGILRALKLPGKRGDEVVEAEMSKLHNIAVFHPESAYVLSQGKRSAALNYLTFLKKKHDGMCKG